MLRLKTSWLRRLSRVGHVNRQMETCLEIVSTYASKLGTPGTALLVDGLGIISGSQ